MRLKISLLMLLVICTSISSSAQIISICNDPTACNFNPESASNDFCIYPSFVIPLVDGVLGDEEYSRANVQGGSSPALTYCLVEGEVLPEGYVFANQECVATVIANDPFCVENSWDMFCQDAYVECCPFNQWYIPASPLNSIPGPMALGSGGGAPSPFTPAVLSCAAPPGYVLAESQMCVEAIVLSDAFCTLIQWDNTCINDYTTCIYGCPDPIVYIPDPCGVPFVVLEQGGGGGDTPAIISCDGAPFGYVEALSQECALSVIANDSFCVEITWDFTCENAYNDCISGCTYAFSCNYEPQAIIDDGSCGYPGCTVAEALNYDPDATCDNSLCVFEESTACAADFNNDGIVSVADLLIFLPIFGGVCVE